MDRCPKCDYQRQPSDARVLAGTCPACGIAYNKYRARASFAKPPAVEAHPRGLMLAQLREHFMQVPEPTDSLMFWGRLMLACIFALWGASFIVAGVDWEAIGGSFLHNVNLPFHEFGHLLFIPFGHFMSILGGSLFQILLPLIFLFAFSFKQKDNFAASIMLWWCGQNFIDVSPYIKDAPYRALPLIRGMGEDAHDWGNLLTMTDSLDSATAIANTSFAIGSLLIIAAIAWAGALLFKMKQHLE